MLNELMLDATIIIFILILWTLIWKSLSLWKAAKKGHKGWFIVLLLINTLAALEILYFFVFSEDRKKKKKKKKK